MNDILSNDEKWGGSRRPERSFQTFRDFVNNNKLIDIGFEGIPWTWSNNWEEEKKIKERLDRVLCSRHWRRENGKAKCLYIENDASDHAILLFDTDSKGGKWKRRQRDTNAKKEIRELKQRLAEVQGDGYANKNRKVRVHKKELKEAYKREEVYWGQKARVRWLKEGDKNTNYFHASVVERRRRNNISSLKKGDGTWCESEHEIENEINGYFQDLFTSSNPQQIESILYDVPLVITDQMNEMLVRPVSEMKIRKAVFSLQPNKAPGPNDDTLIFCIANKEEGEKVMQLLKRYGDASGQVINAEKSSVFFSKNTRKERKAKILDILGGMKEAK
ncbi:uncharacterized protein [Coffea arabica]|uniref:Uncharacterized protein n=1 Tax=Coffea arabica TaxID=13443 RepID=A0ABM4V9Q6_COFAR